jgi:hypothetical protein
VLRVAVFGGSLVFGHEDAEPEAFPAIMERTFPGFEVYNYGVLGYGLDQAFRGYQAEGHQRAPDVVAIGCPRILERCVSDYRQFLNANLSSEPSTKPRFLLR